MLFVHRGLFAGAVSAMREEPCRFSKICDFVPCAACSAGMWFELRLALQLADAPPKAPAYQPGDKIIYGMGVVQRGSVAVMAFGTPCVPG